MKFFEIFFFENCDLEDTSLANKPKKSVKMFLFYHKIGLIKLPPIAKVIRKTKASNVFISEL